MMHGLGTQDIQALASTLQHHQLQQLQQQLQQIAMFQANPAAGQIPPFFLQNQVGARVDYNVSLGESESIQKFHF